MECLWAFVILNSNLASRRFINNKFFAQEKVHLNEIGTKVLAANIGSYLRKINGIPDKGRNQRILDKDLSGETES